MKKLYFLSVVFILFFVSENPKLSAQGIAINTSGLSPDSSAALDINFTNKGFLLPRMTQTQRNNIANPAVGLQIYNTTTGCLNIWTGSFWKKSCFDCDFTVAATNNSPVCAGSTLNLMASSVQGASYSWAGPNGFSSTVQNPVLPSVSTAANGVYALTVSAGGCISNPVLTFTTVSVVPVIPSNNSISGKTTACSSTGGFVYSVAPVADATSYNWTVPSGATITAGQGTDSITVTFGSSSGTISVNASNNCGSSPTISISVNLVLPPAASFTSSPSEAFTNSNIYFTPLPISAGDTFSWSFQNGNPSSDTGQYPFASWSSPGTYNVTVVGTSSVCTTTATGSITITNALPAHGTDTFNFYNGPQTFTVPNGISTVTLQCWGSQGATATGGLGGYATGNLSVGSGQQLYVYVGGQDGTNGGGIGNSGNGGGASDVRVGGTGYANRIIVGGGGGGGYGGFSGGYGGGTVGGPSGYSNNNNAAQGGTQIGGGNWGGGFGTGGLSDYNGGGGYAGSGGGGGWYGGGSNNTAQGAPVTNSAGGGGSGYIGGVTGASMQSGVQTGNGMVVVTY